MALAVRRWLPRSLSAWRPDRVPWPPATTKRGRAAVGEQRRADFARRRAFSPGPETHHRRPARAPGGCGSGGERPVRGGGRQIPGRPSWLPLGAGRGAGAVFYLT
jgi:hypothetical protein